MKSDVRTTVREKVVQLAEASGRNASGLSDTTVIPEAGILDSAGIIELIVWLEERFAITIEDDEMTVEKLGTLEAIDEYVSAKCEK